MNLKGYSETIPEELTLGYIGWYTLYDPKVELPELLDLMKPAFDKDLLPTAPRIGDAFKRACRNAEALGLPIPHTEQFANILFRKVNASTEEVEQHIVIEVVDKKGSRLSYHDAARLTFNRTGNALHIDELVIPTYLEEFRDQGFEDFQREFELARRVIEPQVIRLKFREQLKRMHAITVRSTGSVYFVPISQKDRVERLETFFQGFNNGSEFHTVALMDNSKQRKMVQKALDSEIHDRAEALIERVRELKGREKLPPKTWEKLQVEYKMLKKQHEDYLELLEWNELRADTELAVLDKDWTELLLGGA